MIFIDFLSSYDFPTNGQNLSSGSVLNKRVPRELMSGNHNRTKRYRRSQALQRTLERRPDLLTGRVFDPLDRQLLIACAQQLGPHSVEKDGEKKQDY